LSPSRLSTAGARVRWPCSPTPTEGLTIIAVASIGVPDSVDLMEVQAYLLSQPGVEDVHDLHVWAMSTSDIALTAHLVMPAGHPGDAFFEEITAGLHDRYEITHPTMQIEISRLDHGCAQPRRPADRKSILNPEKRFVSDR
jgi:hypothetical protein